MELNGEHHCTVHHTSLFSTVHNEVQIVFRKKNIEKAKQRDGLMQLLYKEGINIL